MLVQKLQDDLKNALKSGDQQRTETLRFLLAQLQNRSKEKQAAGKDVQLSDEEATEVFQKEAKKRREAIELYTKGNRLDLATKEEKELAIIQTYLPTPLTEEEIVAIIRAAASGGLNDFNSLMKEVSKNTKGKADGRIVVELVKKYLSA